METRLPIESFPGFKFSPTEKELILYYLRRKIEGFQKGLEAIREIDITRHEPWDLPCSFSSSFITKSIIPSDNEWYFFSPRERKYPNGRQNKRATQYGYWKTTGKQRNVKSGNRVVGTKRTLVFHIGQAPKWEKTEWIMHEYCMSGTPNKESFVVCRVRNCKNSEYKCNDIPPEELNQSLTEESSTSTLTNILQHTDNDVEHVEMFQGLTSLDQCNNPILVGQFDSEYCKKSEDVIFQDLVKSYDSESEPEYNKKLGNLFFPDESCSSPKGSVADDCFADMLKDDVTMLDESSFANFLGDELMNDDFMDFNFEQLTESLPPATPTLQGTSPPIIQIRSRQRGKPIKPLPFQGTAPRRIRMKWQHLDQPSVEESCVRDEMHHHNMALSAKFSQCFITRMPDVIVNHRHLTILLRLTVLVVLVLLVWWFFLVHKR